MALKLRRRTRRFTNESLSPQSSRLQLDSLGAGAASFKRVLGSNDRGRLRALIEDRSFSRDKTVSTIAIHAVPEPTGTI
jgi:hypothetical protein